MVRVFCSTRCRCEYSWPRPVTQHARIGPHPAISDGRRAAPVAGGCRPSILRLAVVSYVSARCIYSRSTAGAPLQVEGARILGNHGPRTCLGTAIHLHILY